MPQRGKVRADIHRCCARGAGFVRQTGAGDEMNKESKITREELFPFVHYEYGEAYYGSCGELRYRIGREPLANVHFTPADKRGEATLRAVSWRGPLGYAATPQDRKTVRDFPFSEEGLQQAADWLNSLAVGTEQ